MLAGRPLLAYAIAAAQASRRLTRVVVSTEDEEIARVAGELGGEVPFLRPMALAADETPMLDVLVDLVGSLAERERYQPDVLVLLQPTSPFRRAEHIDAAIDLLTSSGADSVVSVVPVPHQFSPPSLMERRGDTLVPWNMGGGTPGSFPPGQPTRRQEKPLLFARNGPAVVAARTAVVMSRHTLYGPDTRGLLMKREESLDIDDAFDLEVAERLMVSRT